MLNSINKQVYLNLALLIIQQALLDDDKEFFKSDLCTNIEYLIECYTGYSLEKIKKTYYKNTKLDLDVVKTKASYMTCKEMAEEFGKSSDAIYSFCRRHNIQFKRSM